MLSHRTRILASLAAAASRQGAAEGEEDSQRSSSGGGASSSGGGSASRHQSQQRAGKQASVNGTGAGGRSRGRKRQQSNQAGSDSGGERGSSLSGSSPGASPRADSIGRSPSPPKRLPGSPLRRAPGDAASNGASDAAGDAGGDSAAPAQQLRLVATIIDTAIMLAMLRQADTGALLRLLQQQNFVDLDEVRAPLAESCLLNVSSAQHLMPVVVELSTAAAHARCGCRAQSHRSCDRRDVDKHAMAVSLPAADAYAWYSFRVWAPLVTWAAMLSSWPCTSTMAAMQRGWSC